MPRLRLLPRLSLAVLLLAVLGSVAWAKPKVAILGLEASNSGVVEPKDAANAAKLTEELRSIPRNGIGKYELAPNSNRELQDEKLMGNCDTEKPTCMAPIGSGLGADYLIFGNIVKAAEKGKDGYKANLKLLNVKTKMVDEQSETFVSVAALSSGNGAKDWAQKVYAKLTGEKPPAAPERPIEAGAGKLIVKSNVQGGDVFIGTVRKGSLADGPLTLGLPEGSHRLAIEAPGHRRYETTVTVTSGQTKTVDAVLEEVIATGPIRSSRSGSNRGKFKVAGYSLAGVAVASGVYVLVATIRGPIPEYEGLKMQPIDPDTMREIETGSGRCDNEELRSYDAPANEAFNKACTANQRRKYVGALGIATGVLAAGALYFAYRGESKPTETQAMGRRTRRQLTVTPVISPSGGGATVRFDW